MVTAVGGATPYSYLDQLITGKATTPLVPATTTDDDADSSNAATATAAAALGLSPQVVALLQNIGSGSSVSSLLSNSSSTNPFGPLLGESTAPSASDLAVAQYSNVFSTQVSSGLYQSALTAAAAKKAHTALSTDYLSSALAAYNTAFTNTGYLDISS